MLSEHAPDVSHSSSSSIKPSPLPFELGLISPQLSFKLDTLKFQCSAFSAWTPAPVKVSSDGAPTSPLPHNAALITFRALVKRNWAYFTGLVAVINFCIAIVLQMKANFLGLILISLWLWRSALECPRCLEPILTCGGLLAQDNRAFNYLVLIPSSLLAMLIGGMMSFLCYGSDESNDKCKR